MILRESCHPRTVYAAMRGTWRPRTAAFVVVEGCLAWISGSYGLNLLYSSQFRQMVTPATIQSIESIGPLHLFGEGLLLGAALLIIGLVLFRPVIAVAGHTVMAVLLVSLGVSIFQVDALNEVFLVMGLVLHPTMAVALSHDVGTALGSADARK